MRLQVIRLQVKRLRAERLRKEIKIKEREHQEMHERELHARMLRARMLHEQQTQLLEDVDRNNLGSVRLQGAQMTAEFALIEEYVLSGLIIQMQDGTYLVKHRCVGSSILTLYYTDELAILGCSSYFKANIDQDSVLTALTVLQARLFASCSEQKYSRRDASPAQTR